jgi:hypothetical protein
VNIWPALETRVSGQLRDQNSEKGSASVQWNYMQSRHNTVAVDAGCMAAAGCTRGLGVAGQHPPALGSYSSSSRGVHHTGRSDAAAEHDGQAETWVYSTYPQQPQAPGSSRLGGDSLATAQSTGAPVSAAGTSSSTWSGCWQHAGSVRAVTSTGGSSVAEGLASITWAEHCS